MRMQKWVIFLIAFMLLFGCSKNDANNTTNIPSNLPEEGFIKVKQDEYNRMMDILSQWEQKHKNWADDKTFAWVKTEKWDKIEISGGNGIKYTVKDERLLTPKDSYFFGLLFIYNEEKIPPNGFQSDIGSYIYTFYKNGRTYVVRVEERGIIQYEDKYYRVNKYIQNLGKAFIPSPKYIKVNAVLHKIAESGVIIGKYQFPWANFQSFRARGLAEYIQSGMEVGEIMEIKSKLDNPGAIIEELTLYCYGEKINMHIYKHSINIIDRSGSYWYKVIPENNILSVLSAG